MFLSWEMAKTRVAGVAGREGGRPAPAGVQKIVMHCILVRASCLNEESTAMTGMEEKPVHEMWDCLSQMGANVDYLKSLNISDDALLQFYQNVKRITSSHPVPIELA